MDCFSGCFYWCYWYLSYGVVIRSFYFGYALKKKKEKNMEGVDVFWFFFSLILISVFIYVLYRVMFPNGIKHWFEKREKPFHTPLPADWREINAFEHDDELKDPFDDKIIDNQSNTLTANKQTDATRISFVQPPPSPKAAPQPQKRTHRVGVLTHVSEGKWVVQNRDLKDLAPTNDENKFVDDEGYIYKRYNESTRQSIIDDSIGNTIRVTLGEK